ncbi:MAG: TraK family protein [Terriglobales bacterium]
MSAIFQRLYRKPNHNSRIAVGHASALQNINNHLDRQINMGKSYSEELANWAAQRRQPVRRARNKIAFLAVKADVAEALAKGWPVKTIWDHMRELKRIDCSYSSFLDHVTRYIGRQELQQQQHHQQEPRQHVEGHRTKPQQREQGKAPSAGAGTGFSFNAAPNKEELI